MTMRPSGITFTDYEPSKRIGMYCKGIEEWSNMFVVILRRGHKSTSHQFKFSRYRYLGMKNKGLALKAALEYLFLHSVKSKNSNTGYMGLSIINYKGTVSIKVTWANGKGQKGKKGFVLYKGNFDIAFKRAITYRCESMEQEVPTILDTTKALQKAYQLGYQDDKVKTQAEDLNPKEGEDFVDIETGEVGTVENTMHSFMGVKVKFRRGSKSYRLSNHKRIALQNQEVIISDLRMQLNASVGNDTERRHYKDVLTGHELVAIKLRLELKDICLSTEDEMVLGRLNKQKSDWEDDVDKTNGILSGPIDPKLKYNMETYLEQCKDSIHKLDKQINEILIKYNDQ